MSVGPRKPGLYITRGAKIFGAIFYTLNNRLENSYI
jgi:hypothetical protein